MRWIRICVWMVLLCGGLGTGVIGCERAPEKLDLQLYYIPGERGKQAFSDIALFQVELYGDGLLDKDQVMELSPNSTDSIPKVRCKSDDSKFVTFYVQVSGFKDENTDSSPIYSGRQFVRHPCGKPLVLPVFISQVGAFSPLIAFEGSEDEVSRFASNESRLAGHAVTSLPDGRLFITGGGEMKAAGEFKSISNKTFLYDPKSGDFTEGPTMKVGRVFHTVTQVGEHVVIVGGLDAGASSGLKANNSVEVFKVNQEGELTLVGHTTIFGARGFHTATLSPNKKFLLVYGGLDMPDKKWISVLSWETISLDTFSDPRPSNKGALTGDNVRAMHSAVLASNEKVIIAGGLRFENDKHTLVQSVVHVEFVNDGSEVKMTTAPGKLAAGRIGQTATLLANDGGILIAGGMIPSEKSILTPKSVLKSTELLDAQGELQKSGALTLKNPRAFHTTHQLEDGTVLLYGGLSSASKLNSQAELYKPATQGLRKAEPRLINHVKNRFWHSGAILRNGSVMIFGGATLTSGGGYVTLNKGELYNPGKKAKR